jgi:D-alanyl-lipoteichoic acid acyltransferase DltB (MBOAT superfamily)
MGFRIPINFNSPYKARTITEFWQRWHISLSSWLRDYLYIPLGGNRIGKIRTYINLMLTMLLGGLWHGASWRMVIWGGIQGVALAVERFFKIPQWVAKNKWYKIIGILITFHIFTFSMLFFRPQSTEISLDIMDQILNYFHGEVFFQFITGYPVVFGLIVLGFITHYLPNKLDEYSQKIIGNMPVIGKALLLAVVIWLVAQFKSADIQPFIYFQF